MGQEDETLADTIEERRLDEDAPAPALVILWSQDEPERIGEIARITGAVVLGRGAGEPGASRLRWLRQRPGRSRSQPDLAERRLSRSQLQLSATPGGIEVQNVGRAELHVDGRVVQRAEVAQGSILRIKGLVLGVIQRPRLLPDARCRLAEPAWGRADPDGWVGESPEAWALRDRVSFVGARQGHVLVLGESGSGKELVARGIHAASGRADRPLVARNAATLPESLLDAELFGNVEGYPNPGMRARPGLVGEAEGGTLFLDEIAEIPEAMHAHLLRLLDPDGEYHRLGEARSRRADVRVIAATNRPEEALKHDLLARFPWRVQIPGLPARREDIPLLAVHLLQQAAASDPGLAGTFFDAEGWPRLEPELVAALVAHPHTHHVRELRRWLWQAMDEARSTSLGRPADLPWPRGAPPTDPRALTAAAIEAALAEHDGVIEDTWRALGLKNRFQLIRLLKKHRLGRYA